MSGGIGATANEISLPSDGDGGGGGGIPLTSHTASGIFTSFRQLNALVLAVVLAAFGIVSAGELAFAVFSLPYVLFLSRAAFPPHTGDDSPIYSPKNRLIGIHITVGALLGLFLPVAYILEGVIEGDREVIKASVPHAFLYACQIFVESVTISRRLSASDPGVSARILQREEDADARGLGDG